jgi:hypothetical protein
VRSDCAQRRRASAHVLNGLTLAVQLNPRPLASIANFPGTQVSRPRKLALCGRHLSPGASLLPSPQLSCGVSERTRPGSHLLGGKLTRIFRGGLGRSVAVVAVTVGAAGCGNDGGLPPGSEGGAGRCGGLASGRCRSRRQSRGWWPSHGRQGRRDRGCGGEGETAFSATFWAVAPSRRVSSRASRTAAGSVRALRSVAGARTCAERVSSVQRRGRQRVKMLNRVFGSAVCLRSCEVSSRRRDPGREPPRAC